MFIFTFNSGDGGDYQDWIRSFIQQAQDSTIEGLNTNNLNKETINELIQYYEEKEDYAKCAELVKQRDGLEEKENAKRKIKYEIKID